MAGVKIKHRSGAADGATAIGHEFDTKESLVTAGAKLLSVKNAGTEKFSVDKDGNVNTQSVITVAPAAGSAGINAAITTLNALGGGKVQLLPGTYSVVTVAIGTFYIPVFNNITIEGAGDSTILDVQSGAGFTGGCGIAINYTGYATSQAINNVTKGDTSIFTTTPGNASAYLVGDRVRISGLDTDGNFDSEWHEVAVNGIGGTGEVQLRTPVLRTMTGVTSAAGRGNKNNHLKNFKVTHSSGVFQALISFNSGLQCSIEGVTMEEITTVSDGAIGFQSHIKGLLKDCRVRSVPRTGIAIDSSLDSILENCYVDKANSDSASGEYGIKVNGSVDCVIRNNTVLNTAVTAGISNRYGSGAVSRRLLLEGNHVAVAGTYGIEIGSTLGNDGEYNNDNTFLNNKVEGITAGVGLELQAQKKAVVKGNHVYNCATGFRTQGGSDYTIVGNTFERIGTGEGISIQTNRNRFAIIGNIFRTCGGIGIYVDGSKSTVIGNTIETTTGHGIQILQDNNIVQGNLVSGIGGTGIHITATASDNLVVGNNANGEGITDLGTNNILGLNKE